MIVSGISLSSGLAQREESKTLQLAISCPLPPPPSCWGENRAKFSDVVARNQEGAFATFGKSHKSNVFDSQLNFQNSSVDNAKRQIEELRRSEFKYNLKSSFGVQDDNAKRQIEELHRSEYKYNLKSNFGVQDENVKRLNSESAANDLDSYFINTFAEPPVS